MCFNIHCAWNVLSNYQMHRFYVINVYYENLWQKLLLVIILSDQWHCQSKHK